jgi:hypothetical protein
MSDLTLDCLVQIAVEYMESEVTTPETAGILGQVTGKAIAEYFGEDAVMEFQERVRDHGRQVVMDIVADLFDA